MGKVKSFSLLLYDNKCIFYPGETVEGVCTLHVEGPAPKATTVLSIELFGFAKVFWSESNATNGTHFGPVVENSQASEEYIRTRQEWLIPKSNKQQHYAYPFNFKLPLELATSFEGDYGYIRYFLKADLIRGTRVVTGAKVFFAVINPIDTNDWQYQNACEVSDEVRTCCFCCKSGSLQVAAKTDRVAYCAGDAIGFTARLANQSVRIVTPYAVLIQIQKYHAKGLTQRLTFRVAVINGQPLAPGRSAVWDVNNSLIIPAVVPSIFNSKIVEVYYRLKLGLIASLSQEVSVILPIVVGTVPYQQPLLAETAENEEPISMAIDGNIRQYVSDIFDKLYLNTDSRQYVINDEDDDNDDEDDIFSDS